MSIFKNKSEVLLKIVYNICVLQCDKLRLIKINMHWWIGQMFIKTLKAPKADIATEIISYLYYFH